MGIFSSFKQNYQQASLIGANSRRLFKKIENRTDSDFVKHWVSVCAISIDAILSFILFSNQDSGALQELTDNLAKLNENSVFDIFKILCSHYLIVFLANDQNATLLKKMKIDHRFTLEIFSLFDFGAGDEHFYNELRNKRHDASQYNLLLYKTILHKGAGIRGEDVVSALAFSMLLSNSYSQFLATLKREANQCISEANRKAFFAS